jgi:hypothetical protein
VPIDLTGNATDTTGEPIENVAVDFRGMQLALTGWCCLCCCMLSQVGAVYVSVCKGGGCQQQLCKDDCLVMRVCWLIAGCWRDVCWIVTLPVTLEA